ncbi:MAG: tRNA (N6-threonylcarbamoyladenosine(37)-N6)-methyltransferase TrmO [Anaerolineales bacterium]|nr:tRNA (N6-threonylcarbamoyladenosine(37)-N6)-methyltransferase TrmO [Anaerolineales bacterium]
MKITYQPIGILRSPFTQLEQMPIQPSGDSSSPGFARIYPEYLAGLQDLDGFSHLILLYHFHQVTSVKMLVTPYLDSEPHGVFATRAPVRPNSIGISVVRLIGLEQDKLQFADLDVLDKTPLLDIKPYIPDFDTPEDSRIGWLEQDSKDVKTIKSDDRFA